MDATIINQLDDLKRTHSRLMTEYVDVLKEVPPYGLWVSYKNYSLFERPQADQGWLTRLVRLLPIYSRRFDPYRRWLITHFLSLLTLRFLVVLFVQAHIRSKLNDLAVAYIQQSQTLNEGEEDANNIRQWLMETADASTKFADTLWSWRSFRGIVSVVWPALIGLLVAARGEENGDVFTIVWEYLQHPQLPSVQFVAVTIAFPATYLLFFVSTAFEYKRGLFVPSLPIFANMLQKRDNHSRNVYGLEDELFAMIGRTKTPEFPLDVISYALMCLCFGGVLIFFTSGFLNPPEGYERDWGLVMLGFFEIAFILGSGAYVTIRYTRERWNIR